MTSSSRDLPLIVTGAAGFIGARFVESCNQRGVPVISVDTREYFTSRPEHRGLDFGKIIDRDEFLPWLERERPAGLLRDAALHLPLAPLRIEPGEIDHRQGQRPGRRDGLERLALHGGERGAQDLVTADDPGRGRGAGLHAEFRTSQR